MKKILYVVIVALVVLLAGSLLIDNHFHMQSSIMVSAPLTVVFNQANTLKNWEKWNPWIKMDPSLKFSYNTIPSGKGAMLHWDGENPNVGKGSLTIAKSEPEHFIQYTLEFEDRGSGSSSQIFESMGDSVKVTWNFDLDMGYNPIGKYMMKIMNGIMEQTFENGLINMKSVAESSSQGL